MSIIDEGKRELINRDVIILLHEGYYHIKCMGDTFDIDILLDQSDMGRIVEFVNKVKG